ncbi:MAG: UDP-glucose 4-epimerase GalE [Clostridia bacterium]|nr:UDP-glucose 4-epimerase GalE [Clostridia bacterium]MBQ4618698.1 UDP-glucose 4-epimerase GalE [Clostridia bacterium]
MSILITGGAGYIGSHTCLCLLNKGYDIVVVDNLDNSSKESLARVTELTGKEIPFYEVDARETEKMIEIIEKHHVDSVIHFAGLKAVGESVRMPLEYYENNLVSTLHLADAMVKTGVKKLIFSSSATVYSADNEVPLTESGKLGCTNPYGWTKYMNEQILRDVSVAHPDWSVVLLRYFNPVGAHESGKIGEDPSGVPNNLMPYVSQTAVGRREYLTVFGDDYDTPDGTGVRDYIHVMDLAEGHVAAVEYAEKFTGCDAINLGTGVGYSVLDMVKAFEEANGIKVPYKIGPRRPGDLATVYSNPEKAEKVLGWKAKRTLVDMCRDLWTWQKNNPNGYGK